MLGNLPLQGNVNIITARRRNPPEKRGENEKENGFQKNEEIPVLGGYIKIDWRSGGGLYYGKEYIIDGDGNLEGEQEGRWTLEEIESAYKDATGESVRIIIDLWDGEKADVECLNAENYYSAADTLDLFGYYEGDTVSDEDEKNIGETIHEDEYWVLETESGEEVDVISFVREWTKKGCTEDDCPDYGEPERSYWKRVK